MEEILAIPVKIVQFLVSYAFRGLTLWHLILGELEVKSLGILTKLLDNIGRRNLSGKREEVLLLINQSIIRGCGRCSSCCCHDLSVTSFPSLLPLSGTQGAHCLWLQEGGNGVRHIRTGHTGVRPDP